MTTTMTTNSVVVQPKAAVSMILHAATHKNAAVHGLLLGSIKKDVVTIENAVAVSHGAPTKPLIETATGLIGSISAANSSTTMTIVGWYTAPELLQDTRPGPVALRMVAALGADETNNKLEPVLLVLSNVAVSACLQGKASIGTTMAAFGKDFGQQWLEPAKCAVENAAGTSTAAKEGFLAAVQVNDLVDHFEGPEASTPWFPNAAVDKLVQSYCQGA